MARTIEELIPEYIRGLPAYVPGRPIEEVERELRIHAIKLASNENPLGPSPKAVEAAQAALANSNRYPDGGAKRLREALAQRRGVKPDEIFIGLGSSEVIDLASRVLLRPGLEGITSEGSYAPFSLAIRASGATLQLTPLCGLAYDLEAMAKKVTPATRVIYLANPNNPTGSAFGHSELEEFLRAVRDDVLVVLDEAYFHYAERADMPRAVELYREHKNLLSLRTFSKVYGMAGLRVGYAIGAEGIVRAFNQLKTPFNTSNVVQAAALAALDDTEHVRRSIETNRAERKRLIEALGQLGLKTAPSETNFVYVEMGPETPEMCATLLQEGVIVRPLGWMGLPQALRVTVGTPEENEQFLATLRRVLAAKAGKAYSELRPQGGASEIRPQNGRRELAGR